MDCNVVWNLVFVRYPAELFNDRFLAHELLRFLRLNLDSLKSRVPQYTRSFPNLLKVSAGGQTLRAQTCVIRREHPFCVRLQLLAWDGPALVDDFVDLLPSLVTTGTAVELLHTLLDLPCLSATLILQLRCTSGHSCLSRDV